MKNCLAIFGSCHDLEPSKSRAKKKVTKKDGRVITYKAQRFDSLPTQNHGFLAFLVCPMFFLFFFSGFFLVVVTWRYGFVSTGMICLTFSCSWNFNWRIPIWSNYSDLTSFVPPKGSWGTEIPLFQRISTLMKYYFSIRPDQCTSKIYLPVFYLRLFERQAGQKAFSSLWLQTYMPTKIYQQLRAVAPSQPFKYCCILYFCRF